MLVPSWKWVRDPPPPLGLPSGSLSLKKFYQASKLGRIGRIGIRALLSRIGRIGRRGRIGRIGIRALLPKQNVSQLMYCCLSSLA